MKSGLHSHIKILTIILSASAIMVGLTSCSLKKNTAASRNYHAFITRYNVLYNGESRYNETVRQMTESFEDDYSRPIPPHPADAYGIENISRPSGNFSYPIEKAQKAIGLHSITRRPRGKAGHRRDPVYRAWMSRKEYNPVIDKAWILLGNSYYMSGKYDDAAIVFGAAETRFSHDPATVALCRIMQARCRADMGWTLEASMILDRVKEKNLTTRRLRYLYYSTRALTESNRGDFSSASSMALKAAQNAPDSDTTSRLRYLAAQLSDRSGDPMTAAALFDEVANARGFNQSRKLNSIMEAARLKPGLSLNDRLKPLRRLASRNSNKRFNGQIFNTMGEIQLEHGDTMGALSSFEKVARMNDGEPFYRGKAALSTALLKLKKSDYSGARVPLANAVMLLPAHYNGIDTLKEMSDILDRLGDLEKSISTNDSLLRIAAMPETERNRLIEARIKEIRRQSGQTNENLSTTAATMLTDNSAPVVMSLDRDNSWYFYNQRAVEAGRRDFERRWGARKLEDDWRRSVKTTVDRGDDSQADSHDAKNPDEETGQTVHDPLTLNYYLARLPLTPESRAAALRGIEQSLLDYGMIVMTELHDPAKAEQVFDSLFVRFPDNPSRPDVYSTMLKAFAQKGTVASAEKYRLKMAAEFGNTPEGKAMTNPRYVENLMCSVTSQEETYHRAYKAYLEGESATVHHLADSTLDLHPDGHLAPKFLFLDAMAFAAEKNRDGFDRRLSRLVSTFPEADVSPLAADYLDGLRKGRELTGGIVRTVAPATEEKDGQAMTDEDTFVPTQGVEFDFNPDTTHVVAVTFDNSTVNMNKLIFEIARFNFSTFDTRDFDITPIGLEGNTGLSIATFGNYNDALDYISRFVRANSAMMNTVRLTPLPLADLDRLIVNSMTIDHYIKTRAEALAAEGNEK